MCRSSWVEILLNIINFSKPVCRKCSRMHHGNELVDKFACILLEISFNGRSNLHQKLLLTDIEQDSLNPSIFYPIVNQLHPVKKSTKAALGLQSSMNCQGNCICSLFCYSLKTMIHQIKVAAHYPAQPVLLEMKNTANF